LICPAPVEIASQVAANHLFRIAQEAVNNSVRHSDCDSIIIELQSWPDTVVLSVTDNGESSAKDGAADGNGGKNPHEGFGQRTMRYRAREMHGHLDIATTDSGTSVICRAPNHQT
jgi:signal transduction histidine kinase